MPYLLSCAVPCLVSVKIGVRRLHSCCENIFVLPSCCPHYRIVKATYRKLWGILVYEYYVSVEF